VLIFLNNFKKKIGDKYTDDDLREFVKSTLSAGQVCDMSVSRLLVVYSTCCNSLLVKAARRYVSVFCS